MKYTEEYQIEFKDCDENRRLKLPALVELMMQVSEPTHTSYANKLFNSNNKTTNFIPSDKIFGY